MIDVVNLTVPAWRQISQMTVWHRSHCTQAQSQLGSLASIKGWKQQPTHPIVFSHLAHHPIRTPVATRNGRPLTGLGRTRGRGSGSHLTRAFAGSKLLYPALLTAPGTYWCTGPYPRRWVTRTDRCATQSDSPSGPHTSHSLGPKLRRHARASFDQVLEQPPPFASTSNRSKLKDTLHAIAVTRKLDCRYPTCRLVGIGKRFTKSPGHDGNSGTYEKKKTKYVNIQVSPLLPL